MPERIGKEERYLVPWMRTWGIVGECVADVTVEQRTRGSNLYLKWCAIWLRSTGCREDHLYIARGPHEEFESVCTDDANLSLKTTCLFIHSS